MGERDDSVSQVFLTVGDVVRISGIQYVIDYTNDCRARAIPLEKKDVTIKALCADEEKSFQKTGRTISLATRVDASAVIERRGRAWLEEFIGAKKAAKLRVGDGAAINNNEESENSMSKAKNAVKDKTKARGGLAAEKAQDEAAAATTKRSKKAATNGEAETGSRGKLGELMGFSITSVLRRLGKEGVTVPHALAILEARKIPAAPATVQIQIGNGRNGKLDPAELTKAQVAELIASAPEPVKEVKEPKAKKKGKKAAAAEAAAESDEKPAVKAGTGE